MWLLQYLEGFWILWGSKRKLSCSHCATGKWSKHRQIMTEQYRTNNTHTHILRGQFCGKTREARPGFLFSANRKQKQSKVPKYDVQNFIYFTYLEQAAPAEMLLPITSPLLAGSRRAAHLRLCALAEALLYTLQSGSRTLSSPNRWLRVEWNYAFNLLVAAIKVQIKVQYIRSAYTRIELYHSSTIVILWFIWS